MLVPDDAEDEDDDKFKTVVVVKLVSVKRLLQ